MKRKVGRRIRRKRGIVAWEEEEKVDMWHKNEIKNIKRKKKKG